MKNEILKILGEIDGLTRDEFADGNIGSEAYLAITKKLSDLNRKVKQEIPSSDIVKSLHLNEKANKKLEFISGRGFRHNFPEAQPDGEWIGAVLDLLEETGQ